MAKETKPVNRCRIRGSSYHGWDRWRCQPRDGQCVVTGYVEATGLWQTIAVTCGTPSAVEAVVRLVEVVNGREDDGDLLPSALEILIVLEEEGFTFATEMELEHVIEKLERRSISGLRRC